MDFKMEQDTKLLNIEAIKKEFPDSDTTVTRPSDRGGLIYKCEVCARQFSVQVELDVHMETHTKSKFHSCLKCGKAFTTKEFLDIHSQRHASILIKEKSAEIELYKCFICSKMFSTKQFLEAHMTKHEPDEVDGLESKIKMDSNESESNFLHRELTGTVESLYRCLFCEKSFRSKYVLSEHIETHQRQLDQQEFKKEAVSCHVCAKTFASKTELLAHYQSHYCQPYRPDFRYKCFKCHARFSTQKDLDQHKGTHIYHKCMYCTMSCNTFDDLVSHLNTHTEHALALPCKCSVCEEEFVNKEVMEIHHQKHIFFKGGTLTHKCLTCGERFPNKRSLNGHFSVHRFDKTFKCYLCTLSCSTHEELVLHMKSHGKGLPESKDKTLPFKCESCGNRFHSRNALIGHRRVHDLYKRKAVYYQCSFCDKEFATEQTLANHVEQHVAKKQKDTWDEQFGFLCKVCGRCFHSKRALISHKGIHSRFSKIVRRRTVRKKKFIDEKALEIHGKEHINKKQNGQSPVTCISCGKRFHNRYALSGHTGHGCQTVLSMYRTRRTKHL